MYYFDPGTIELHVGDWVVVESVRGRALAQVVIAPGQVLASQITEPLKPVVRKATQDDVELASDLQQKEREALRKAEAMVSEMNLPMKVVYAECNLEANHVTIFFRAEERVDFRDLVKRLSTALKMRVELRQAGPRDAAKLLGGMGRCGRTLCCATFLTELMPVSIRMAKEQDLPLNPTKISGVCGRLLCCLSYEVDSYRAAKAEKKAAAAAQAAAAPPAQAEPAEAEEEGKGEAEEEATAAGTKAGKIEVKPEEQGETKKRRRQRRRKKRPLAQVMPQIQGAPGAPQDAALPQTPQSLGAVQAVQPAPPAPPAPIIVPEARPEQPPTMQ